MKRPDVRALTPAIQSDPTGPGRAKRALPFGLRVRRLGRTWLRVADPRSERDEAQRFYRVRPE